MSRSANPRDRRIVMLLVMVWLALAVGTVLWGVPHIERSLTTEAEDALLGTSVDVRLSGRDATLVAGGTASDAEAARMAVESIAGVRTATVDLVASALQQVTVTPDTTPEVQEPVLVDPSITIRGDRGVFTLTGSVADEDTVLALDAAAIAAYGQTRITSNIDIVADTHAPAWLDDPFNLLAIVGRHDLGIEVYDKLMRVTGVVPDEATHAEMISDLEAELDGALTIVDRVLVFTVNDPVFSMTNNDGSIILRGTMPSQGEINVIREAAEQIYGSDSVATWLEVDPGIDARPYLTEAEPFFRAFEGRTLELIDTEDMLVLRGVVPDEEIRTRIGDALTAIVDPRGLTNELEVIAPDEATQTAIDEINSLIGSSLNFAPGSTTLGENDQEKLAQVAAIFEANPGLRAVVEGHTDSIGGPITNQLISEERAGAVVDYLVELGVDPDRLSTIGYGEERPIASNNTSSGRAQNRRIEFNVEGSG